MAEKNMNAKISVEFEETANRQQLSSGDNLPTLFGKIKKIISDLSTSAFSGSYNDLTNTPNSLPANGGNADTVNGLTVQTAVPADAVFTDTIYTLPTASESELGGIKVDGTTVTIDENGVITVNMTENIPFKILKGTVTTTTTGATEVKFSKSFASTPTVICAVMEDDYTISVGYTAFMTLVNANLFRVFAKKLDSGSPSNWIATVHWVAFGV